MRFKQTARNVTKERKNKQSKNTDTCKRLVRFCNIAIMQNLKFIYNINIDIFIRNKKSLFKKEINRNLFIVTCK